MVESKADFARRMGWKARSTATRYAEAGKIVMTKDGLVDVEASIARLKATADPDKEGVRQRHERARNTGKDEGDAGRVDPNDTAYQLLTKHRAATEASKSELARLELEEKQGLLVNAEAVRKRAMLTARAARDAVMNLRFRIDPLLSGESDPVKRAAIWDLETRRICEEIARGITTATGPAGHGGASGAPTAALALS